MSVTQWHRRSSKKSSASNKGLSVSLSSKPYSFAKGTTIDGSTLVVFGILASKAAYLVYLLQHRGASSSPHVHDVYLAKLMPIYGDRTDFLYSILVAQPMEEVVDPAYKKLFTDIQPLWRGILSTQKRGVCGRQKKILQARRGQNVFTLCR